MVAVGISRKRRYKLETKILTGEEDISQKDRYNPEMRKLIYFTSVLTFLTITAIAEHCQSQTLDYLFKSGTEGYHTFRIPALITTSQGHILAFAEGRKKGQSDTGDIDIVMKKSTDNGNTWSDLKVIWDEGENVCGNPAPVVDKKTGTIYLLCTWNLGRDQESEIINQTSEDIRRVYVTLSEDDGDSWAVPVEITDQVKKENWTWYATGPCHGMQIRNGKYKDRLIIPCDHIEAVTKKYYSHIIYSDDHGKTWKLGGSTPQDQVNECTVAELPGGKLILNMRNYDRTQKTRKISHSDDGGITWSDIYPDPALIEPICQASMLRFSFTDEGASRLIFSNPANENKRENMTVRISYDEGATWARSMVLFEGPSAYSDLTRLANGSIACLYEAGYDNPYQGIVFQEILIKDMED
jgi:sialidase-1